MSDKLPPKILLIEPEEALSASVSNSIERSWFDVIKVNKEEEAIKAASASPNIAVISSRIKNISAIEIAYKIRIKGKDPSLPIIFLVDKSESIENYNLKDNNHIELLYRPFTPNELMTKIKSLLRKSQPIFQDKLIKYKDVSMDIATYKVFRRNKTIHLGPTEFKILQLFMQSPKVIFSRQQIINYVWGVDKEIEYRTVDVHVNRLRTLIKIEHENLPFIKTVRASGYCLNLPGEID